MEDNQVKAGLKLLGIFVLLEVAGIAMFCYTYFVKGYFGVKNLAAICLGLLVIIMIIIKMIQNRKG